MCAIQTVRKVRSHFYLDFVLFFPNFDIFVYDLRAKWMYLISIRKKKKNDEIRLTSITIINPIQSNPCPTAEHSSQNKSIQVAKLVFIVMWFFPWTETNSQKTLHVNIIVFFFNFWIITHHQCLYSSVSICGH